MDTFQCGLNYMGAMPMQVRNVAAAGFCSFVTVVKGKLRSRNILSYMKAHIPSISKIVVIWCSTGLNLSSGSLKSLKITTLEHQRPPS